MIRARTAALAAVATLLSGCGVANAGQSSVDWQDCGNGVRCATMTVPVDWRRPGGPTTLTNLAEVPAKDPAHRLGALIVNWGSGSSTSTVHANPRPPVYDELTAHFDVVVIDSRGVGQADNHTLVPCPHPQPLPFDLVKATSQADWDAHARANAAYDAGCRQAAGPLFDGLTSWQTAHDIEALRVALGEPKLRYIGNSYGATYGQAYAELFPTHVQSMFLDGVPDHTQPRLEDWLRDRAVTQEQQLFRFRDWCGQSPNCVLRGSDPVRIWDDLVAHPPQGVTAGQLEMGMLNSLLTPPTWPKLAQALAKARDGDPSDFLTKIAPPPPESSGYLLGVTLCHDYLPNVPSYQAFQPIEQRLKAVAPHIGWTEGRLELGRCIGIPGRPSYPPAPLRAAGMPPALVAIGQLDSNAPNLGAAHVATQFPGARALWHGDGHAAYFLHGNTCLNGYVIRYLTDGALPSPGTRCPAEMMVP
ncbi:alpha/beta fold hydrolase [Kutzneria kofuensis]|uniref:Pimeloyl-ACP methyl ester carboxylesterase n=1 Tax=Kutzneria kofuensis TaxID=103725 RepID=A0A7W9NL38_9PSEU|nr:alpha/beta fold hydrolase [Kutzneria kofuensis]MBB5896031.1 pimeloyl-ACP methyl ester carboxylesterase [Kutzneria kofuensis]